jgi:hypothetical protein
MSTILNEEIAAQTWLQAYLAADTTLGSLVNGVWIHSVPKTQPLPVVKIDRQDASDLYTVGLYRVWDDLLFLVRGAVHWVGSGQQDWTLSQQIADRLDVLLHKHSETSTTVSVDCFRESSYIDEQPVADGSLIMHCGGMYRVRAHAL